MRQKIASTRECSSATTSIQAVSIENVKISSVFPLKYDDYRSSHCEIHLVNFCVQKGILIEMGFQNIINLNPKGAIVLAGGGSVRFSDNLGRQGVTVLRRKHTDP